MKDIYQEEVSKFTEEQRRKVGKADFAGVFGRAFLRAFTQENIHAAFRATGIHPFNSSVISENQMKSSEPTALHGSFPVELPSPVKAVAKAFRDSPPTRFDIEVSVESAALEGVNAHDTSLLDEQDTPHSPSSPATIVPQRRAPGSLAPAERLRLLTTNLSATKTGAYLVSKDSLNAKQPTPSILLPSMSDLPTPDWSILKRKSSPHATRDELVARVANLELALGVAEAGINARDQVIETDRTQLILQDLHLQKQQEALKVKSGTKKSKSRKMKSDGLGTHLMDPAYIEERRRFDSEKKKEKRAKAKWQHERELKKVAKEKAEARWKTYFENWKRLDAEWRTQTRGVPKSRQPPKPQRTLKPAFIASAIEEELALLKDDLGETETEDKGAGSDDSDWESMEGGEGGEDDDF